MAREGDKWRVVRGDCLWNIAKSVYNNGNKWTAIADANGINRSKGTIYAGQLLKLPGITPGTSAGGASTPAAVSKNNKKVTKRWWALDADTDRQMYCVWEWTKDHTAGYSIEVWYDTGNGAGWRQQTTTSVNIKQYQVTFDSNAKKGKLRIKAYPATHTVNNKEVNWWNPKDAEWLDLIYDFTQNPPLIPSVPEIELVNEKLTCSLSNIDVNINANQIEFSVYKNNTTKYKTGIGNINTETRYVSFVFDLEPGGSYTVRCRAVRNKNIYSNWTDFTNPVKTIPITPTEIIYLRPQVISEQGSRQYGIYVEWTNVSSATNYKIQYTTDPSYFDTPGGLVEEITTEENQGNKYLISNIDIGHEYYFRVCSLNTAGSSGWTPIKATTIGSRPSAPTTWSNVANCVIGEQLRLYWTHNSTDGSLESVARLHISAEDPLTPGEPYEVTKVIHNDRPEEEKDQPSVYILDTTDQEWSFLTQGFIITWKVQTAGVIDEYSEWSIEREANVYLTPSLTIDIQNQNGESVDEINSFPFYINIASEPYTQTPLSYYVEIVANDAYETVDGSGKKIVVNQGDKVYQRYYDPTTNPWEFIVEMTPGNLDLKSGISYTVNCTVAMNSGLTASNSQSFDVLWTEQYYEVAADINLNRETLEANIHPYCNEYYIDEITGETMTKLSENCTLSVYRKEYDGSYTLIGNNINNDENTFIVDPHPTLDYARYRVTSTSNDTGSISFGDITPILFGIKSVVIQWEEDSNPFTTDEESEEEQVISSTSIIQIPYNVDISESAKVDVNTIEYVGRKHPVSYYGTHLNESFNANVEIPRDDLALIYDLRRLAKYNGDVYVREPSGIGYWANVTVQFSLKHNTTTIPVTFNVTRVEGGI